MSKKALNLMPDSYRSVTAYLTVGNTAKAMTSTPKRLAPPMRRRSGSARADRAMETRFWGDRMGSMFDPFDHKRSLVTHVKDVSPEEMTKRMAAWSESQDCRSAHHCVTVQR